MESRRAALLRLVCVAGLAALPAAAPAAPPAPRAAAVWTLDRAASRLGFRAAMAGKPFDGVVKRWDAQLAFDPADLPASRLQVTAEVGSAVTGDPARDALLPSPAWLGARRFPQASFTSRAFAPEGGDRYKVSGVLTLHGVSRPAEAEVRIDVARDRLTLAGGLPLDRRAFGVGPAGSETGGAVAQMQLRLAARRTR